VWYRLEVSTSPTKGAGTDAGISLQLHSRDNQLRSGPHPLDRPGAFERGCCDVFEVMGVDVGRPAVLTVASDGGGPRSSWRLEGVVVHVLEGQGGRAVSSVYFPAGDR